MNCPRCGNEMMSGEARIHGTFWAFLVVGFSYEHLYFKGSSFGDEERRVLTSGKRTEASRCEVCGLVVISEKSSTR